MQFFKQISSIFNW